MLSHDVADAFPKLKSHYTCSTAIIMNANISLTVNLAKIRKDFQPYYIQYHNTCTAIIYVIHLWNPTSQQFYYTVLWQLSLLVNSQLYLCTIKVSHTPQQLCTIANISTQSNREQVGTQTFDVWSDQVVGSALDESVMALDDRTFFSLSTLSGCTDAGFGLFLLKTTWKSVCGRINE